MQHSIRDKNINVDHILDVYRVIALWLNFVLQIDVISCVLWNFLDYKRVVLL